MAARLWLVIGLAGCGAPPTSLAPDADTSAVSYYRDVRPILAEHCLGCHVDGGGAPFALDSAARAIEHGPMIAYVTERRIMPPWPADASGACQRHVGARRLPDEAIALLRAWVEGGLVEGDAATAAPLPEPTPPPTLRVDALLDPGAPFTPPDGDEYRCFPVDPEVAETRYLTAFAPRLDRADLVHHIQLYALDSAEAEADVARLDADEPGPGYQCFGGPIALARYVGVWAPGDRVRRMPAGTGLELGAGRRMVMQIHYHAGADAGPDRSQLELELAASVDRVGELASVRSFALALPSGSPEVTESAVRQLPTRFDPPFIWATRIHMHTLGVRARLELLPGVGGDPICLLDIPRWDFEWQLMYAYQEPIAAARGDQVRLTCVFDTTSRDEVTRWGAGTEDEMCLAYLYMTGPAPSTGSARTGGAARTSSPVPVRALRQARWVMANSAKSATAE